MKKILGCFSARFLKIPCCIVEIAARTGHPNCKFYERRTGPARRPKRVTMHTLSSKTEKVNQNQESTFGSRLRDLRIKYHLNQEGAAQKFYVSKSTWSKYETNKRDPKFPTLKAICEAWRVSADYLLFGETIENENVVDLSGLSARMAHAVKVMVDESRKN